MNSIKYYNLLGVNPEASLSEIKTAFRKKAKLLHPDINSSPNAEIEFIKINEAYEYILNEKQNINTTHLSEEEFQHEKERIFEEWMRQQQNQARQRAQYYAEQSFEDFIKSDIFKKASVFYIKKSFS